MLFNINNFKDVESICSFIAKSSGKLEIDKRTTFEEILELDESFSFRMNDTDMYIISIAQVNTRIEEDIRNREDFPEVDITIMIEESQLLDFEYFNMSEYMKKDKRICIHTESKILAPLGGIKYTDNGNQWLHGSNRSVTCAPETKGLIVSSGKRPLFGYDHLGLNLDIYLLYERDEEYIETLHKISESNNIYVLDEYSLFLLEMDGLQGEILK